MKNAAKSVAIMAILISAWASAPARGGEEKTFRGEIADSQCALNVHSLSQSHKEMIGMNSSLKTDAECIRYCVKERGGRYVLQAKGKVYRLDRQDLAEQSIGGIVKVVGALDPKTSTIAVKSIEAIAASPAATTAQSKSKN